MKKNKTNRDASERNLSDKSFQHLSIYITSSPEIGWYYIDNNKEKAGKPQRNKDKTTRWEGKSSNSTNRNREHQVLDINIIIIKE